MARVAESVVSRGISSNEVTLNQVARCGGVREIDPVQAVAGDQIPRGKRWATDRIVRGKNVDAGNAVSECDRPRDVRPDEVSDDQIVVFRIRSRCERGNQNAVCSVGAEDIALTRCQPADRIIRRLDGDSVATTAC